MKPYFITGIGTGIGKTLITCALAHQLRKEGKSVRAIKPVISGFDVDDAEASDTGALLAAQGIAITPDSIAATSPWRFAAPLSPDMAAEDEGKALDVEQITAFCHAQKEDIVLIEGVGGLMVPLNTQHTVLDWMLALNAPVILVAGSYLGALNHTLLSARAILSAGLALQAVVISESEVSPVSLPRMQATLRRFLPPETVLAAIARLDYSRDLWKYVPTLTHTVCI